LVAAHQGLRSVLTEDEGPATNTDDAIALYTTFWMTAMLPESALGTI
jgi:hypothetical protein